MKKLMLGLMMAFAVSAEAEIILKVRIGDLTYNLDTYSELGVSVCSNADIIASTANWAPVKFTPDTKIGLSADGTKLILPIPVAAQQGFMILQSGEAKAVPPEEGTSGFFMIKVGQ